MKTLGVILARMGSAGLKNKHLLPLCGKPVIQYTFDHAAAAKSLSRVVVSTDCPKIQQLAKENHLEVIQRPAELATATASVQDAMLHAMSVVESGGEFVADALVVLYGNVPLRPAGAIDRAVDLLQTSGCDSVRSFCPVGKWHPAWMSRLDGDRVVPFEAGSVHRRQDLPALYLHDGAVVAVSQQSMLRGRENPSDPHAFFGTDRRGIIVESGQTVEIDEPKDFYLAEALIQSQNSRC